MGLREFSSTAKNRTNSVSQSVEHQWCRSVSCVRLDRPSRSDLALCATSIGVGRLRILGGGGGPRLRILGGDKFPAGT